MNLNRKFAGAAAAVALLAGAGGAYAVNSGSSRDSGRDAFLGDVAKRLNVSTDQLEAAFKGALSDKLDRDVAAGRLTRQQADEIKKRVDEHGGVPFFGGGPPPPPGGPGRPPFPGPPPPGAPPPFGHPGPAGPLGAGIDAAAKYLGLTRAELRAKFRSGKSLADVAKDVGKPVDGLKGAIEDAAKSALDKAVADKKITAEEEQHALDELHQHVDDIVNGRPGDRPPRPPRRGWDRRHARGHW
jgi:hypothetical protein